VENQPANLEILIHAPEAETLGDAILKALVYVRQQLNILGEGSMPIERLLVPQILGGREAGNFLPDWNQENYRLIGRTTSGRNRMEPADRNFAAASLRVSPAFERISG
jgi:hypothetical protein